MQGKHAGSRDVNSGALFLRKKIAFFVNLWYSENSARRCTAAGGLSDSGRCFFGGLPAKGGDVMVTYSDLIQIGILVVSICNLFYTMKKK